METRARVVLIGLFMLAATAAMAASSLAAQLRRPRRAHRLPHPIRDSAVGLRSGSSVLFNGIRVGEVTEVRLNPADPREVTVLIAVERNTPIRADTRVEIFTQGLMGSPTVALIGGASTAPPLAGAERTPPLLIAEPGAGQDVMQAARDLIRRLDKLVAENSEALRNAITNLSTFSDALARNSGRLDAIAEGLVRMTGGGPAKAPPTVYDLTAPKAFPGLAKVPDRQLAIPEPTATLGLDTQRILVSSAPGEPPAFADVQWSDSLPKLIQARIIQGFENARFPRVVRASEATSADFQLAIDLRNFPRRFASRSPRWSSAPRSSAREGASCRRGFSRPRPRPRASTPRRRRKPSIPRSRRP
jgi:phospholipid/cholesterol/gamma-HCH transport system substrate-binding protein